MAWTTPRTWASGEVVTAANMNLYVRDNLSYLFTRTAVETGDVLAYGSSSIPSGYFECNGQAVNRTTYAALFALLSTTYGVGDGSTTFNVPDFRGRSVLGAGTGSGLTARARGQLGGAETVGLTVAEIESHRHSITDPGHNHTWGSAGSTTGGATPQSPLLGSGADTVFGEDAAPNISVQNQGSGSGHANMQPWTAVTWIIKA